MSEKAIGVGDLVMIVRWPCCNAGLGETYIVSGMNNIERVYCECGTRQPDGYHVFGYGPAAKRCGAPLAWLKRIDPAANSESTERTKELCHE